MLCQNCNKQEAVISFTEVKNKEKKEVHLCQECAQKVSPYIDHPSFSYSLHDFLGHFLELVALKAREEDGKLQCEVCQLTYADFQKKTRFGCANDYEVFQKPLHYLFQGIHGSSEHKGKVPSGFGEEKKRIELKKKLEKAIQEERYEDAGEINKQIKRMEGKKDGSG